MVSHDRGEDLCGFEEQPSTSTNPPDSSNSDSRIATPLDTSTSRKTLLNSGETSSSSSSTGLSKLRISKVVPSRLQILKLSSPTGLSSPSAKFKQIVEGRDEMSRSVPSSTTQRFRERLQRTLSRKINWESMFDMFRTWIKSPLNMVLLLWITCVAASGALLFLVMTGMLNHAIPKKSQRDIWFEVNNQILNALFTLMCLYQHPKRFYHLVLLCRWKPPKDITTLRNAYCKNGTYKPNEWAHMLLVISLLHLNCLAQYALCGLNLGYRRSARPAIGVAICLSVAIAAPAIASVYCIVSPLGKEYEDSSELGNDVESQSHRRLSSEKRFSFASRSDLTENAPVWKGGLFDIWDDISVAYLSLFCTCCAFGWNMERLGFGNMYVHIATFMLFCSAPFWIFNLAAVNIDNDTARSAMGLVGVVLCVFGLLYGGFWRIRMRKRFNLPAANKDVCCGKPEVADCAQWLCCCWCSLAQEVRTADFYDVVENKFYRKQGNEQLPTTISPLHREGTNSSPAPSRPTRLNYSTGRPVFEIQPQFSVEEDDDAMKPPVLPSIRREEESSGTK